MSLLCPACLQYADEGPCSSCGESLVAVEPEPPPPRTFTRDEKITLALILGLKHILSEKPEKWIAKVLEQGFVGFSEYTDDDLEEEIAQHGLGDDELDKLLIQVKG